MKICYHARAGTSTKKSEWLVCVVVRTEDFLLEISLEKQDLSSATQTPRTWAQEAFKASHQTYIHGVDFIEGRCIVKRC